MKSSNAPEGKHVRVEVTIGLSSGWSGTYSWTTPMGLFQALHKAPTWAQEEMARDKVKGRSKIVRCRVWADIEDGPFKRDSE